MKTEVAVKATGEKTIVKSMEERVVVQGVRRSLHPLQIAAGDKENLVGAGRLSKDMPTGKDVLITKTSDVVSIKKQRISRSEPRAVTVEDLTSDEPPSASSSYWQILCERQRAALEKAHDENKELKERIQLLEDENAQCKVLLDDAKALIDTLKELLSEPDEECEEE